jgi:hypothetical protein
MAKSHGAKDQKRTAKQKAKRLAKRAVLTQRASTDPTIRLQDAAKWPIVRAHLGGKIWKDGIGHALIARREPAGGLVYAVFLIDVYCLGVKSAFWRTGSSSEIDEVIKKIENFEDMRDIDPACLAKAITGAVAYARSFGFSPDPDYRHAAKLLDGIDPSTCATTFTYGHDGRPLYIQGPHESPAEVEAILRVIQSAGGHFMVGGPLNDDDDEAEDFRSGFGPVERADETSDDE